MATARRLTSSQQQSRPQGGTSTAPLPSAVAPHPSSRSNWRDWQWTSIRPETAPDPSPEAGRAGAGPSTAREGGVAPPPLSRQSGVSNHVNRALLLSRESTLQSRESALRSLSDDAVVPAQEAEAELEHFTKALTSMLQKKLRQHCNRLQKGASGKGGGHLEDSMLEHSKASASQSQFLEGETSLVGDTSKATIVGSQNPPPTATQIDAEPSPWSPMVVFHGEFGEGNDSSARKGSTALQPSKQVVDKFSTSARKSLCPAITPNRRESKPNRTPSVSITPRSEPITTLPLIASKEAVPTLNAQPAEGRPKTTVDPNASNRPKSPLAGAPGNLATPDTGTTDVAVEAVTEGVTAVQPTTPAKPIGKESSGATPSVLRKLNPQVEKELLQRVVALRVKETEKLQTLAFHFSGVMSAARVSERRRILLEAEQSAKRVLEKGQRLDELLAAMNETLQDLQQRIKAAEKSGVQVDARTLAACRSIKLQVEELKNRRKEFDSVIESCANRSPPQDPMANFALDPELQKVVGEGKTIEKFEASFKSAEGANVNIRSTGSQKGNAKTAVAGELNRGSSDKSLKRKNSTGEKQRIIQAETNPAQAQELPNERIASKSLVDQSRSSARPETIPKPKRKLSSGNPLEGKPAPDPEASKAKLNGGKGTLAAPVALQLPSNEPLPSPSPSNDDTLRSSTSRTSLSPRGTLKVSFRGEPAPTPSSAIASTNSLDTTPTLSPAEEMLTPPSTATPTAGRRSTQPLIPANADPVGIVRPSPVVPTHEHRTEVLTGDPVKGGAARSDQSIPSHPAAAPTPPPPRHHKATSRPTIIEPSPQPVQHLTVPGSRSAAANTTSPRSPSLASPNSVSIVGTPHGPSFALVPPEGARKRDRRLKSHSSKSVSAHYSTAEREQDVLALQSATESLGAAVASLTEALLKEEEGQAAKRTHQKRDRRDVLRELQAAVAGGNLSTSTQEGKNVAEVECTEMDKAMIRGQLEAAMSAQTTATRELAAAKAALATRKQLLDQVRHDHLAKTADLEKELEKVNFEAMKAEQTRGDLFFKYWRWKKQVECGDNRVGRTFAEHLQQGPRRREVGVQNEIQSDYMPEQLLKVVRLMKRHEQFKVYLNRIRILVDEVLTIHGRMEKNLKCFECYELLDDPVALWPCGHTFCAKCILSMSIGTSLYRCRMCEAVGAEGSVANVTMSDILSRWRFQSSGMRSLDESMHSIQTGLEVFRKDEAKKKVQQLATALRFRLGGSVTVVDPVEPEEETGGLSSSSRAMLSPLSPNPPPASSISGGPRSSRVLSSASLPKASNMAIDPDSHPKISITTRYLKLESVQVQLGNLRSKAMPRFSATEDFQSGGKSYRFRPVAVTSRRNATEIMRDICENALQYSQTLIKELQSHLQEHVKSLLDKTEVSKFVKLLTEDELFVVVWYTSDVRRFVEGVSERMNWWYVINAALRAGDEMVVAEHSTALSMLLSACQKLAQAISGSTSEISEFYRGLNGISLDDFPVGGTITWPAFSSASLDPDVALAFCGGSDRTLLKVVDEGQTFAVLGTLSAFPDEKEVAFLPGTVIQVKQAFRAGSSGIKTYVKTSSLADFNLVVCKVVNRGTDSTLARVGALASTAPRIQASELIGELRQLAFSDRGSSLTIDRELLSTVVSGGLRAYRPSEHQRSVSPDPARSGINLDRGIKNAWNRFQHEYVRVHSDRRVTKEELVNAYHEWKDGGSADKGVSKSTAPSTKATSVAQANTDGDQRGPSLSKKPIDSDKSSPKDGRSDNPWNEFQAQHKGEYSKPEMLDAYRAQSSSQPQSSRGPPASSNYPATQYTTPTGRPVEPDGRSGNSWNEFQAQHKGEYSRLEMLEAYQASKAEKQTQPAYSPPARPQNVPINSSTTPVRPSGSASRSSNSWNDFQAQHKGEYSRTEMQGAYRAQSSTQSQPAYSPPQRSYNPPARSSSPPASSGSAGRSGNSWNDFQAQHKGEYSRAEMKEAYGKSKR